MHRFPWSKHVSLPLCMLVGIGGAWPADAQASPADAQASPDGPIVAVLPMRVESKALVDDQDALSHRMKRRLREIGVDARASDTGQGERKANGGECDEVCRRDAAATLKAAYVVGGRVQGQHDSFEVLLWLADGNSGKVLDDVSRRCDVCSANDLADTVELACSALHAKLAVLIKSPATLEVTTTPNSAVIYVDKELMGPAPRTIELPAGEHTITARAEGHRAESKRVNLIEGGKERVLIDLQPVKPDPWRSRIGWTGVTLGALAAVAGVSMLILHGDKVDCRPGQAFGEICGGTRNTAAWGWVTLGLGAAALLGGTYLLIWGDPDTPQEPTVALTPAGGGMSLHATF